MKFNKTNFALAAGFTVAIISFIMHVLMRFMSWGGMMNMGNRMYNMPTKGCPMTGIGIIVGPIVAFFVAAGAGWLFAFFYNKLSKK